MSVAAESAAPKIIRTQSAAVTTLRPTGSLTEEAFLTELHASVEHAIESGENQIVIDLVSVPSLNSAALEAMLDYQDQLIRAGGWVKFSHVGPTAREILRVTDTDQYISIVGEEAANDGRSEEKAPSAKRKRLGELFVAAGLLSEAQLKEALELQKKTGKRLGSTVISKGWASDKDVLQLLSEQLNIHFVQLRSRIYDPAVV